MGTFPRSEDPGGKVPWLMGLGRDHPFAEDQVSKYRSCNIDLGQYLRHPDLKRRGIPGYPALGLAVGIVDLSSIVDIRRAIAVGNGLLCPEELE